MPLTKQRRDELKAALQSGDEAGYCNGFEIGDEDHAEYRNTRLERGELRSLLDAADREEEAVALLRRCQEWKVTGRDFVGLQIDVRDFLSRRGGKS